MVSLLRPPQKREWNVSIILTGYCQTKKSFKRKFNKTKDKYFVIGHALFNLILIKYHRSRRGLVGSVLAY